MYSLPTVMLIIASAPTFFASIFLTTPSEPMCLTFSTSTFTFLKVSVRTLFLNALWYDGIRLFDLTVIKVPFAFSFNTIPVMLYLVDSFFG